MAPRNLDDHLRRYLEDPNEQARSAPEHGPRVDIGRLHQHFLHRLRQREESDPNWVRRTHRKWSSELQRFAQHIERTAHLDPLGADVLTQVFAAKALDAALCCLDTDISLVTKLELQRISGDFESGSLLGEYCLETRLARHAPDGKLDVTALGRAFLRLRGRDALHWLLAVEVAQSQGDHDPWRASSILLTKALDGPIAPIPHLDPSYKEFPFEETTLDRLHGFGLLHASARVSPNNIDIHAYYAPEPLHELFRSVLKGGPIGAAVNALLEDERALTAPMTGPPATEATIEQTRLIAHEVRNALGPVRYNVDELLSEDLEATDRSKVEAAKKGVARVLDFIDQMVSTSEMITEPSTTFEVAGLIREAIGWIDGSDGVELDLPEHPLRLRAPRPRFLRALLDVIRNALQSATPPPPVRISARRHDREVRIVVDDGGPGVPSELRTRVFDDGFTTRPGGSGFGLAFLRQVVERELRGTVSCEEADLGGARFTISIPNSEPAP